MGSAPLMVWPPVMIHGFRRAEDVQSQLGLPAHGVDVTEGVGGGDFAVEVGIIHNGREKVGGLDQGQILAQHIDAGVVAFVVSHHQPGVRMGLEAIQHFGQGSGPHLGAAAGAGGQLGEFYLCFHPALSRLRPDDLASGFHPLHNLVHVGDAAHGHFIPQAVEIQAGAAGEDGDPF